MKRSEVNEIIRESDKFIRSFGYVMPPFAYWSPEELKARTSSDSKAILQARLGWDITDYGQGKFDELGLFLFTTRNGNQEDLKKGGGMLYAEKIMISQGKAAVTDAPPYRQGGRHHQSRRRHARPRAVQFQSRWQRR